ncbi:conserved protein of unknown function [Candidatus Filomicrobium marinum]|uniref:Transmembrane protein n=2 Tax=Filomicrobium TaxID=119044 RepID=A0A0D6JEN5_9HYPH|nr:MULTISPECIES: TIGR02186 family protein [Filomicrobium]MCV0367821.1 TIGR02186 family protein [Filomicrobium sp.]CFX20224.1 conserved protein of unknown function [Candidatus Filomicrobium marinum]CPR18624.1 conserved protein of unknown function [Candidatus Filomicrobium marinum]SDO16285.1 conserved hypothetical protein [Filomicrobium insigne]
MGLRELNESVRVWWTEVRASEVGRIFTVRNIALAVAAVLIVLAIAFSWPKSEKAPQPKSPSESAAKAPAKPQPAPETQPKAKSEPGTITTTPPLATAPARRGTSVGRETVEADVSTRSVSITSNFSGTEIVVFGAVDDSHQETAEAGIYDVVVVVEGTQVPLVARRKSNVAGIWINTESVKFERVPSYYAIASTRPIEEIADERVLRTQQIGFTHVPMMPDPTTKSQLKEKELEQFRDAVIRLKKDDGLFIKKPYGVAFIGKALFRTSIDLPANVPVGPLTTKVYLFRDGSLLADYEAHVTLQREGMEAFLHSFAFDRPFLYGLFAVFLAVTAGLAASAFFRRRGGAH